MMSTSRDQGETGILACLNGAGLCVPGVLLFGATLFAVPIVNESRADTHYVDINNAAPSSPYTSWATAATNIQPAIDESTAGDTVLVSNGLYNTGGIIDWPAGGLLTNRVVVSNAIIVRAVSADPADTIIAGCPDSGTGSNGNSAVRGVYLAANAVLAGFTVTNGYTRVWSSAIDGYGGAVYADPSSVVSNCVLTGSHANQGGGLYNGNCIDCVVSDNVGVSGGGLRSAVVTNSLIVGNSGSYGGGGNATDFYSSSIISNYANSHGGGCVGGTVVDCDVMWNTSVSHSSGLSSGVNAIRCRIMYNTKGGAGLSTLDNCIVMRNSGSGAAVLGGTARNCLIAENTSAAVSWSCVISKGWGGLPMPTFYNCTIVNNTSHVDKAVIEFGVFTNSIVFNNGPLEFLNSTSAVDYCCISSASVFTNVSGGANNITNAPVFVSPANTNYHSRWGAPTTDAGFDLSNSGVTNDLDGVVRPQDGDGVGGAAFDIGCYEYVPPPGGTLFYSW